MIPVLDTSILIDLLKRDKNTSYRLRRLSEVYDESPQITFPNYFEFIIGLEKKNIKNKEKALIFINDFNLINTTKDTAHILASLKSKYDKLGLALTLMDLLISALVIENKMVLITKDKHFERLEELKKVILD